MSPDLLIAVLSALGGAVTAILGALPAYRRRSRDNKARVDLIEHLQSERDAIRVEAARQTGVHAAEREAWQRMRIGYTQHIAKLEARVRDLWLDKHNLLELADERTKRLMDSGPGGLEDSQEAADELLLLTQPAPFYQDGKG